MSKSMDNPTPAVIATTCKEFCSNKCAFLNSSAGDTGVPETVVLFRVTPRNVTDLRNKNTGSSAGDLTFRYSAMLGGAGAFLAGDNIVGRFPVTVDGRWGPYKECNPLYGWDTREWFCENADCETPPHCNASAWEDSSSMFTGIACECPRANRTVGRVNMGAADIRYAKTWHKPGWPSTCSQSFQQVVANGSAGSFGCYGGDVAQTLTGSTFEETAAHLCDACTSDVKCDGWAIHGSNTTGYTYHNGKEIPAPHGTGECKAMRRGVPGWINVGGDWYSTTAEGECRGTAKPGDGSGCSWKLETPSEVKFINQSCLDDRVDEVVESIGAECFKGCGSAAVKAKEGVCYYRCYDKTVGGDPYKGIAPIPQDTLTSAWEKAFESEAPTQGGCPREPIAYSN
eukprot:gene7892-27072_t